MEGQDRGEPMLAAAEQRVAKVVNGRPRDVAPLGLDPGPPDAEAQGVEADSRHQDDVVAIAVVDIARVTGGFDAGGTGRVLPRPPVAVDVASFDLVGRLRGTEEKAVGEGPHGRTLRRYLSLRMRCCRGRRVPSTHARGCAGGSGRASMAPGSSPLTHPTSIERSSCPSPISPRSRASACARSTTPSGTGAILRGRPRIG